MQFDFLYFLENSGFESGSCNQINYVNVNTFENRQHYNLLEQPVGALIIVQQDLKLDRGRLTKNFNVFGFQIKPDFSVWTGEGKIEVLLLRILEKTGVFRW